MATVAEQLTSLANTKTAIKQAIIDKGVSVADTDPFSAYPAKIGEISGGAPATKFGASIDTIIGDVVDGVLQKSTAPTALNFAGVREIGNEALPRYAFFGCKGITSVDLSSVHNVGDGGLYYAFGECTGITSVYLSSLQSVDSDGLYGAFRECTGITSVDLSSLQTVGDNGLSYAFFGCTGITSVDLSSLQIVGRYGLHSVFNYCSSLASVDLSSLQTVSGFSNLQYMFSGCTSLTTISFPSLTSVENINSFVNAFQNCTALTEIHFRADMQETIEAMSGYENKWGATNATIYFDLIGTITVDGIAYARDEKQSISVNGVKTFVAWKDESDNIVYTAATIEPAVDTVVYSDAGTTQVGTAEAVA